ncbi:MAG: hypothetical protein LBC97_16270 [Bifidobacteriaceae bacterium]|jgi:ABC-type multidrug transport system fused ATPase/permease subunit|nr:hypothetical protein [Bifidobacteriaceae bacterium]
MYGWLWRYAPGPWWVKIMLFAAVAAAIVAICFTTFFPWLSPLLPFNHVTVGDEEPTTVESTQSLGGFDLP